MRLVRFNLEDFVTNVNWSMKAIFEINGHWIEGILSYSLDNKFGLSVYNFEFDRYLMFDEFIKDITFYVPLD